MIFRKPAKDEAGKIDHDPIESDPEFLSIAQRLAKIGSWSWEVATGRVIWSDEMYELYGFKPHEISPSFDTLLRYTLPEDRPASHIALEEAKRNKQPFDFFYRIVRPDGAIRTLRAMGIIETEIDNSVVRMTGAAQDVTDLKSGDPLAITSEVQFKKALEAGTARLRTELAAQKRQQEMLQALANTTDTLFESKMAYKERVDKLAEIVVPDFADWCTIDLIMDGKISYTVKAHADPEKIAWAEELERKYPPKAGFHASADVIKTKKPLLIEHLTGEMIRPAMQSEEHFEIIKSLGLSSIMIVPLVARGHAIGAMTFVAAESGRHYNQEDLRFAEQLAHRGAIALDNALLHQQLEEENRMKERFLAMLAHELRNPLTPISNSLPILMARADQDAEVKDIAEIMDRQIKTMSHLLDDLLDIARITEGKIQFRMEEIDLLTIIRHTLSAMRPELEKKGFKFSEYLAEGPFYIRADKVRIEQILMNLLNNAAKYTPKGGHIALECVREGDVAVIRVRDTGKGVPPEMLRKIFHLFTQVEQSIDRPEGGLGLGLTLVQSLVEHHGGTVTAESEGLGKGSIFTVRLPLLAEGQRTAQTPESRPLTRDAGKRILIVDDNEDAANSIGKLLRRLGHDVRIAYDGISALEAAKEQDPEVGLFDLGLPGMDGYETARRFRALYGEKPLLLIALSGYGQEEDRRRAKEAGFDHHLIKPFDTQELRDILNGWEG